MTVNCGSMDMKKDELIAIVNYLKPDVICGTESLLKANVNQR